MLLLLLLQSHLLLVLQKLLLLLLLNVVKLLRHRQWFVRWRRIIGTGILLLQFRVQALLLLPHLSHHSRTLGCLHCCCRRRRRCRAAATYGKSPNSSWLWWEIACKRCRCISRRPYRRSCSTVVLLFKRVHGGSGWLRRLLGLVAWLPVWV